MIKGLIPIAVAQHYEEQLPSEDEGVKESHSREQATLARIADMQKQAFFRGQMLTLRAKILAKEAEKLFAEPKRVKKENLPGIKMKDLEPLELNAEGLAKRQTL